jgi:threonine synthase
LIPAPSYRINHASAQKDQGAAMQYVSTRGQAPALGFSGVLLAGLAEDGGLYVPDTFPTFSPAEFHALRGLPYAEVAARVIHPFTGTDLPFETLLGLCRDAYAGFDHPAVAPLVQLDTGLWTQELFHGPTLAFKDMAMQLLGRLFDHFLTQRDERVTIVGATSGDTGSAAIEACANRARVDIVILHPHGRTSEVQRRQMTTVRAGNVGNIAVDGTFDDCQDLVKAMFADAPFRRDLRLSAVNSINWARVAAQVPYYVYAALALGAPDREVAFSVPTGNFGNVLAAWVARRMGLPVAKLLVGSNRNDILFRFLASNDMSIQGVEPSLSPSMDIQVSSNFERLLFEILGRDPAATARTMAQFRATGRMAVPDAAWRQASSVFQGFRLDDAGTLAAIHGLHAATGYLADPHSVIAIEAARAHPAAPGIPTVAMATAHPAKFPDAIERATGVRPPLPPRLADLYERPESYVRAPNDLAAVEAEVRATVLRNAA